MATKNVHIPGKALAGLLAAALVLAAGCATTKKVGGSVGGAFKTAGEATAKGVTWTGEKVAEPFDGDDGEDED